MKPAQEAAVIVGGSVALTALIVLGLFVFIVLFGEFWGGLSFVGVFVLILFFVTWRFLARDSDS